MFAWAGVVLDNNPPLAWLFEGDLRAIEVISELLRASRGHLRAIEGHSVGLVGCRKLEVTLFYTNLCGCCSFFLCTTKINMAVCVHVTTLSQTEADFGQ